ncbi:uncharacterized protein LOC134231053 isoform X2 [Saccostrea cucullata]|uniref:uncharacterized protein LOC134231053 isoform X2 n=1 Tax=Saccostrea cuccullata TaxID=36930 RepID=UPI002ED27BC3
MFKTPVKIMLILESLSMSAMTFPYMCADCTVGVTFPRCKKCIAFKSEKGSLTFQCKRGFFDFLKQEIIFTALCYICKKNKTEFSCQKCTTFAEIKHCNLQHTNLYPSTVRSNTIRLDNFNETAIDNSSSKECEPCPECNPTCTTIAVKESTEEVTPEIRSPSTFECEPCPDSNTMNLVAKECTEEVTPETQSPSTFGSASCPGCAPIDDEYVTAKGNIDEATSRTHEQSPSSFECASCPECSPMSTEGKTLADEGTFNPNIHTSSVCTVGDLLGYIVVAVVGGALFGTFITAFVFIVLRRRTARQKGEPTSDALQSLIESNINRQAVQDHSNESRRASLNTNNKMAKGPEETTEFIAEEDGVYNHLNESETVDRDEYYDHARASAPVQSENNNDDYDHAGPSFLTVSTIDDYAT